MQTRLAIVLALLAVVSPIAANADDGAALSVAGRHTGAVSARPEPRRWYGWQIALSDAAASAFFVGFVAAGNASGDLGSYPGLAYTAGGVYALGGPLVHLGHDRPWYALGSGVLRLGLPLALAGIGAGCARPREETGCQAGVLNGFLVGVVAAVVVDVAVLSWEPVPPPTKQARVTPTFAVDRGRFTLGLAGAF